MYLGKGRQVHVEGRMVVDPATGGPRIWERQDGTAGASFEIRASNVTFLGGRGNDAGEPVAANDAAGQEESEDIPF